MRKSALLIAAALFASQALAIEEEPVKEGKALPVFQVVKFPNDVCDGGSRNGTCYTAEECSSKGGTNSGSCASGYGVCCVFTLACGSTTSENSTYLVQAAATTIASPCTYKVCKCSTDVCRIRFDFTSFMIANPVTSVTGGADNAKIAPTKNTGGAIGDCTTDTFSVTAPGGTGSPVICGTNSGYHMIVDASDTCHEATFTIGDSSTSRSWDIKITQYNCGEEDNAGWQGCLQYYTATAGNIASFNFPSTTMVGSTATHLSSQRYNICIRRGSGMCAICYSPTRNGANNGVAETDQNSFGLSISPTIDAGQASVSTSCIADYLEIPYADLPTKAAGVAPVVAETPASIVHRLCCRVFNNAAASIASATVCTKRTPFTVGVNFDANEATAGDTNMLATTTETSRAPGGIVGFKLTYFQVAC